MCHDQDTATSLAPSIIVFIKTIPEERLASLKRGEKRQLIIKNSSSCAQEIADYMKSQGLENSIELIEPPDGNPLLFYRILNGEGEELASQVRLLPGVEKAQVYIDADGDKTMKRGIIRRSGETEK
jgi:hypothetical protein